MHAVTLPRVLLIVVFRISLIIQQFIMVFSYGNSLGEVTSLLLNFCLRTRGTRLLSIKKGYTISGSLQGTSYYFLQ